MTDSFFLFYLYQIEDDKKLAEKINSFLPLLNEEQKRIYLATETIYLGRGGKAKIDWRIS